MGDEAKVSTPDWERIEIEFRAGVLSLREIAAAHGSNHVAISRRAKKEGWGRDLSARVKARAEEIVTKRAVTADETARRSVTEKEVVEVNAQVQADIVLAHRTDIQRNRRLSMNLLAELELTTDNKELFAQLGELLCAPDDKGQDKRNEIYGKVISMGGRIDSAKKLAETLKVLVGLEREAFGLDSRRADELPQTIFNMSL